MLIRNNISPDSPFTPKTMAVFSASGLGDALLAMQVAFQLTVQGWQVTLYSSVLRTMASWFPVPIKPFPLENNLETELSHYDHIIAADYTAVSRRMEPSKRVSILYERDFDRSKTMLDNFLTFCHRRFHCSQVPLRPFLTPTDLGFRRNFRRVIMAPTSGSELRNWPGEKYVELGKCLQKEGFDPVIAVSASEAPVWDWVQKNGLPLVFFSTIDDMASYYYESGFFIGNDSGGGHLASLLHVPTLTLAARASYLRLWRPGWGTGCIVTPFISLPGARLKQKHWKRLLTVRHVLKAFRRLVNGS